MIFLVESWEEPEQVLGSSTIPNEDLGEQLVYHYAANHDGNGWVEHKFYWEPKGASWNLISWTSKFQELLFNVASKVKAKAKPVLGRKGF